MKEKQYKPVPDVECLKYHGTPEKPDIKIFVSHRIDQDSETIDNPLYIPVRCGAVYDEREGVTMLGDDTGDNISEKRVSFCEFTVMYWAWKNISADYYGLCHYRRYLSFSEIQHDEWNEQRFYYENILTPKNANLHGLLSVQRMRKSIINNDITTSVTYEAESVPIIPACHSVRELFTKHPSLLTSDETLNYARKTVKRKFPQYLNAFDAELDSKVHRGFNCFIMRKSLFNLMCEYLFGVLFELDELQENHAIEKSNSREMGYVGEILYGSFIRWSFMQECYQIKEQHIVLFGDTTRHKTCGFKGLYQKIKAFLRRILPAYRCSLRVEEKVQQQQIMISQQNEKITQLNFMLNEALTEIRHINRREIATFWTQPHDFEYNSDSEKLAFWNTYPKATGDLRIIQEANAALLKRLKKICEFLGVHFWLHGGSLIGGLRHAGFVPWDDDIDIAMMREDFHKLKEYLSCNTIYGLTEYYYIAIGARSYRFRRLDIDSNCFVDIFVYDHYNVEFVNELLDWRSLTQKKTHLIQKSKELCRDLQSYPEEPTLEGFPELRQALDSLFATYIKRSQGLKSSEWVLWGMDNNYEGPQAFAWNHGRIFLKTDIFPLQKCMYEGEEFLIPNNFEKYTFAEYGIRYVEMPKNLGDSIHLKEFYSAPNQLELAKELIEKEQEECQ